MLQGCGVELCLGEELEVMRCVLLCMLEAPKSEFYLLEVFEVLEVMRRVQICMLEAGRVSSVCWRRWRCWRCRS